MKIARFLCLISYSIISIPVSSANPQLPGTDAATLGLTELTDDMSRQQLFAEIQTADRQGSPADIKRAHDAGQTFALNGPFRFPSDTLYDSSLNKPRLASLFVT